MTGPETPATPEALAAALNAHNRWRRDDDGDEPAPDPTELGKTIGAAAGMLRALSVRLAALEAERAAVVPAGFVLVPAEPTDAMTRAAVVYANGNAVYKNVAAEALKIEESIYAEVYAAMLAAAPTPTGDAT